jgi:hypothetical protein
MHLRPFFFLSAFIMCIKASPAPIATGLQLAKRQIVAESGATCSITCNDPGASGMVPNPSDCENIVYNQLANDRTYQI